MAAAVETSLPQPVSTLPSTTAGADMSVDMVGVEEAETVSAETPQAYSSRELANNETNGADLRMFHR